MPSPARHTPSGFLPAGVWALGFVSLLMDASSELVHSLLPVFMATSLGASYVTIGLVEGVAEATASVARVFSGSLSDRIQKRKVLVVLGYGLGACSKPLFPLATSVAWVFAARVVDRIGKGIRGAPRDALVADITPAPRRGAAYGLRQALDSVGALLGPVLAVALMAWFANDIPTVLWVAVIPAVLSVTVLVAAVREPLRAPSDRGAWSLMSGREFGLLPRRYWEIVGLAGVFTLARFSEAFLILRAGDVGLPVGYVPTVMIVMNVVYAGAAYPAGAAADRVSVKALLGIGLGVLIVADLVLAAATNPTQVFVGTACWGLHMALTQGLFSKLVADAAAPELRGTAFGVFHLVVGAALLAASLVAGALWNGVGPKATFLAGAAFATMAIVGVVAYRPKPSGIEPEAR